MSLFLSGYSIMIDGSRDRLILSLRQLALSRNYYSLQRIEDYNGLYPWLKGSIPVLLPNWLALPIMVQGTETKMVFILKSLSGD